MSKFLLLAVLLAAQGDWDTHSRRADQFYREGKLQDAVKAAAAALQSAASEEQRGASLNQLGFLEYSAGTLPEAEKHLLEGLRIRTRMGRDNLDAAATMMNLAMLYRDARRLKEALALAQEGAQIRAKLLGPADLNYAESLNILGTVLHFLGDNGKAEETLEQALRIHQAKLDPAKPSEDYGTLCANYANIAQRIGKYERSAELFRMAFEAIAINPGKGHPSYGATLAGAGVLAMDLGNLAESDRLTSEAERLLASQLGPTHPLMAIVLNNHGVLYHTLGDFAAAEKSYARAIEVRTKNGDKVGTAITKRNLGRLVQERDPQQAERYYLEARALLDAVPGRPDQEYVRVLLTIGEVQRLLGRPGEAGATLEQAHNLAVKTLGPTHPAVAAILSQSGQAASDQGDAEQAERLLQQAIDLDRKARGEAHHELARHYTALARHYHRRKRYDESLLAFQRADTVQERVRLQVLATGSESAKAAMMANMTDLAPSVIALHQESGDGASRTLAFELVTRRKGRATEFIRDWRTRLRTNSNEQTRALLTEWTQLTECESTLAVVLGYRDWQRPPAGGCSLQGTEFAGRFDMLAHELRTRWTKEQAEKGLEAIRVLRARADMLEERLSRNTPSFRQEAARVSAADIQAALKSDEALIEFVRLDSGYGAFVLPSSGPPAWIDLGAAADVDRAVRDVLDAAGDWSESLSLREAGPAAEAERTADRAIARISSGVLQPALSQIAALPHVKRLRIAPDGMLLLLPFEALSWKGSPLLERYAISYLLAGREAADGYELPLGLREPLIAVSPGPDARRSAPVAVAFRTETLTRIEGAAAEARQLSSLMPRARLLKEGEATEEELKRVASPGLMHIIGHGVVRGKDCKECNSADRAAGVANLSAIVMDEAYGRGKGSRQDGLLTARELRNLDLNGTQMLVLSQCRMADGIATAGDGVYGMRRAAALAGARTLVAPLWKISDSTQRVLMASFYKDLRAGVDRAEAIRRAKLQVRAKPNSRHFFHWAPMILSGDARPLPPALFEPAASR